MDKDLVNKKLVEYLNHLETATRSGADFAAQQIPDIIREIITYNLITSILFSILGFFIFVVQIGLFTYCIKKWNYLREEVKIVLLIPNLFLSCLNIPLFCINVPRAIQCYFAPKYFVLQEIIKMLSYSS